MPSKACPGISTESDSDSDDVDVYVSPRHFVGRTPGARATKQKIFEEHLSSPYKDNQSPSQKNAAQTEITLGMENARSPIDKDPKKNNDSSATSSIICTWVCLVANYVLAFCSIHLLVISIWVFTTQGDSGLEAFIATEGVGLRSPLAYGLCLLIASIIGIINGLILGVKHISPLIIEGFKIDWRQKTFFMHQMLSFLLVLILSLVLTSSIPPFAHVPRTGINAATWRGMAKNYPYNVCAFQVTRNCAGPLNYVCSSPGASASISCPGHYCANTCQVSRRHSSPRVEDCSNCVSLKSSSLLRTCVETEARRSSSRNCLDPLTEDAYRFFILLIVSTSVTLGSTLFVILSSTLGPLLSS